MSCRTTSCHRGARHHHRKPGVVVGPGTGPGNAAAGGSSPKGTVLGPCAATTAEIKESRCFQAAGPDGPHPVAGHVSWQAGTATARSCLRQTVHCHVHAGHRCCLHTTVTPSRSHRNISTWKWLTAGVWNGPPCRHLATWTLRPASAPFDRDCGGAVEARVLRPRRSGKCLKTTTPAACCSCPRTQQCS